MNEEIIRIEDIINILKRKWKMISIITLSITLMSAVISFFLIQPKYEAVTKLFIGKESTQNQNQDQSYNNNDVQMYQKLLKTYAEVIETRDLIENSLENSNLNLESKDVLRNLTVTPRADTQILEISYISNDPNASKEVVELVTNEFINYSVELIPNGNVKVIEKVRTPENPISPNKIMNISIAFIIGLFLSIGLSFVAELMDNTFKTKEDVESILKLPAIGVIPNEFDFK